MSSECSVRVFILPTPCRCRAFMAAVRRCARDRTTRPSTSATSASTRAGAGEGVGAGVTAASGGFDAAAPPSPSRSELERLPSVAELAPPLTSFRPGK